MITLSDELMKRLDIAWFHLQKVIMAEHEHIISQIDLDTEAVEAVEKLAVRMAKRFSEIVFVAKNADDFYVTKSGISKNRTEALEFRDKEEAEKAIRFKRGYHVLGRLPVKKE